MKVFVGLLKMIFLVVWSMLTIIGSMLLTYITFDRSIAIDCGRKIWAPVLLWVFGVKLDVKGLEKISKNDTFILMSNHSSYLDIPILFAIMPFNLYFVAKKELGKVPFLGFYLRRVEMILIDRENTSAAKKSMDEAGESIRGGKTVVIFPEGTSKGGATIGSFKKGGFHLAQAARVPILPVRITGTNEIWPNPTKPKINKGVVQVVIGDPIDPVLETKEDISKAAIETKELIEELN
ncbi:MAG: 1-acyl-sn-glycerol-3-phosphate acyltransferase [Crocinitomicaceae bacterium]|nr:1-acyl-sn-glycerol-3-phosphate acyltransferase [Crocinitomicaceae bacterium]